MEMQRGLIRRVFRTLLCLPARRDAGRERLPYNRSVIQVLSLLLLFLLPLTPSPCPPFSISSSKSVLVVCAPAADNAYLSALPPQGNKSFVPFSNLSDADTLTKTWKVRTHSTPTLPPS